jgi:ABC-type nitrate/sulfonate/bicarbonate transport system substrate-binding protein
MLAIMLLLQSLTVAIAGPPTSPEYLPVRVAEAEGYFKREGLSVTLRATRAEPGAAEALTQGQADLAATSLEAVLRFGRRPSTPLPRLVFGLSAAPAVRLLTGAGNAGVVRSVRDLAGGKVAVATTAAPEETWLLALLARAEVGASKVEMVAVGARGLSAAMNGSDVRGALVPEPLAGRLVEEGRATLLVDFLSPRTVTEALGAPTVNAGVFTRGDRRLSDRDVEAFARALLSAERRIATASATGLATTLPPAVVGSADEFERRLEATRSMYLPDGLVPLEAVRHTIEMMRTHLPFPQLLGIPRAEDILHVEPLRRALGNR